MRRQIIGFVGTGCLVVALPTFASGQFSECIKHYQGEANRYNTCFSKIANQDLDARKKKYEADLQQLQKESKERLENLPRDEPVTQITQDQKINSPREPSAQKESDKDDQPQPQTKPSQPSIQFY